jgi:hypothetical protein
MESFMCHQREERIREKGREVTIIPMLADLGRWKALCATQREERIRESGGRYPLLPC